MILTFLSLVGNIHWSYRSIFVRHIQGIKPIRPCELYQGNHPLCRLGASYPRTLSWEYQQPSASTVRPFDPPFLPLLDLCVISSKNQSSVVSRNSSSLLCHHSIHQFSFKPSEFISKSGWVIRSYSRTYQEVSEPLNRYLSVHFIIFPSSSSIFYLTSSFLFF